LKRTTIAFLGLILPVAALAQQKLPDPDKVAPQYRQAAQKRREQVIRRMACILNADKEKVLKRDLAAYINHCMDFAEKTLFDSQKTKP
jgi:CHAD domain-containing protein